MLGLDWHEYVAKDDRYIRPSEVPVLKGNPSKAKQCLGWEAKTKFKDLVKIMVEADLALAKESCRNERKS
jgi:GDPmannose 4,6-dehydratase